MPAARASPIYQRRKPEAQSSNRTAQTHLDTFLARTVGEDGGGLQPFVIRELRAYLRCGVLARGCLQVQWRAIFALGGLRAGNVGQDSCISYRSLMTSDVGALAL